MDRRESFLAVLARLEQWLASQHIPYAVFGSLAAAAWTGQGETLGFDRRGARHPAERVPDIDLLVPRASLARVSTYAAAARCGPFPVAIDTFWAECWIDLRPGQQSSYLTHRRVRIPAPTELFTPSTTLLLGQPVSALDPRVLLHLYQVAGPARRKDAPRIAALTATLASGTLASRFTGNDCHAFTAFRTARRRRHPVFFAAKHGWVALLDMLPAAASQALLRRVQQPANQVFRTLNRRQARHTAARPGTQPSGRNRLARSPR